MAAKTPEELREDPTCDMLYVVGDCRGRIDLLEEMFERIKQYPVLAKNDKIIILGSFLDFNHTKDFQYAINVLRNFKESYPNQVHIIRGAQEHRLIRCKKSLLSSKEGQRFINSYRNGTQVYYGQTTRERILKVDNIMRDIKWLYENTEKYLITKNFFMCSSGVNPQIPLEKQIKNSLMYLSASFHTSEKMMEKIIVHGNSSRSKPIKAANKIDLSSDPVNTGLLTCFVLDDTRGEVFGILEAKGEPLNSKPKEKIKDVFNKTFVKKTA